MATKTSSQLADRNKSKYLKNIFVVLLGLISTYLFGIKRYLLRLKQRFMNLLSSKKEINNMCSKSQLLNKYFSSLAMKIVWLTNQALIFPQEEDQNL